jgi:hypothetical protein
VQAYAAHRRPPCISDLLWLNSLTGHNQPFPRRPGRKTSIRQLKSPAHSCSPALIPSFSASILLSTHVSVCLFSPVSPTRNHSHARLPLHASLHACLYVCSRKGTIVRCAAKGKPDPVTNPQVRIYAGDNATSHISSFHVCVSARAGVRMCVWGGRTGGWGGGGNGQEAIARSPAKPSVISFTLTPKGVLWHAHGFGLLSGFREHHVTDCDTCAADTTAKQEARQHVTTVTHVTCALLPAWQAYRGIIINTDPRF